MGRLTNWQRRKDAMLDRWHARRAGREAVARAFVSAPEPRTMGQFAKGRQLVSGNFMFAGHLVQAPNAMIWDLSQGHEAFEADVQGCTWLDDLAAVGDTRAREAAQKWVWGWIAAYGEGAGPGWTAPLTARRLIRWINHAPFVLRGQDAIASNAFFGSLSRQTAFLARRWKAAPVGLPRFEALTGMIYASVSLEGMDDHIPAAVAALARDCETQIDAHGAIASRNPEELMEICTLLGWARQAIDESGVDLPDAIPAAMARAVPVLRALRHSDGALARFHGGGRGKDGRLDQVLAQVRGAPRPVVEQSYMGYARLTAGRTSLVADADFPPVGPVGARAHAATLAFELTSGRRPLIVNCGAGTIFGPEWQRAGRATASHSTLGIEGYSSARLDAQGCLAEGPKAVTHAVERLVDGTRLKMSHDGWRPTHGVIHRRTLDLTFDGRGLVGEDVLIAEGAVDVRQFDNALAATQLLGIPYAIRFHLHPDVDAELDLGGTAVSVALKSGEVWIFRHNGMAELSLASSVYLGTERLKPRAAKQVVLSWRTMTYSTAVRWSWSKAQDTPVALRDYAPADSELE